MKRYSELQVIVVCFCLLRVGASSDYKLGEPHCFSRFDYEYKVLQKLIQLEEGHKQLEEAHKNLEEENKELGEANKKLEAAHKDLVEKNKARDIEIEDQSSEIRALRGLVNTTHLYNSDSKGPVVAFSAFTDTDTSMGTKTVFDKVLINEPAAYDQSTGVFTCPVEGVYLFSFVIAVRGSATSYGKLTINENVVLAAITEGREGSDDKQGSNIGIIKLDKDDRVWVQGSGTLPGNSNGVSNSRTSSFSGVLLHRANE